VTATVKPGPAIESALAAVAAHPLRVQSLAILTERVSSPTRIARDLGETVANVSYHVKVLKNLNLIEKVGERRVRGSIESFYRVVEQPYLSDEEWANLSIEERGPTTLSALQLSLADAAAAIHAGTFDARSDRYLVRSPLLVDEEGWRELNALHAEAYERTLEIQVASEERMAKDPDGEQIPVTSITMFFERPLGATPAR
jgi:DNA-binding transcriptional ArsR family regulator